MRYCGREFNLEEIHWIKNTVSGNPKITRHQLSIRFCEEFNWKKVDGGLKDMSCRVAQLRMDQYGLITLPSPRKGHFHKNRKIQRTREGEAKPELVGKAQFFRVSYHFFFDFDCDPDTDPDY